MAEERSKEFQVFEKQNFKQELRRGNFKFFKLRTVTPHDTIYDSNVSSSSSDDDDTGVTESLHNA